MSLTKLQVEKIKEPGRYGDGDGLWLQVSKLDPDKAVPFGSVVVFGCAVLGGPPFLAFGSADFG